jgi:hypothetical protein
VLKSAIHVLRNVKGTMLTTASNVHKHAADALRNAEGWLAKYISTQIICYDPRLACSKNNIDRSTKPILLKPYNLDQIPKIWVYFHLRRRIILE